MHFHYHTLCHLSNYLNKKLSGDQVFACLSQNKNELVLEMESLALRIGCFTPQNYVVPIQGFIKAKKNVVNLFEELIGKNFIKSRVLPYERVLILEFEGNQDLVLIMHSASANILFRVDGEVKGIFISQREQDDTFQEKAGQYNEKAIGAPTIQIENEQDVLKAVVAISPVYEKTFAKRIWADIQDGRTFSQAFTQILEEVKSNTFYIQRQPDRIRFFLFRPQNDKGLVAIKGIANALDFFLRMHFTFQHYKSIYQQLGKELRKPVKKFKKILKGYQDNIQKLRHERDSEEIGHLLMANLHAIQTGLTQVELEDFYTQAKTKIKLKAELSPQENAARYYAKAKQSKAKLKYLEGELEDIESKFLKAQQEFEALDRLTPPADLHFSEDGFDYDQIKKLKLLARLHQKDQKTESQSKYPFRTFERDGYQIFVGKNAKNNDLLSFKFAQKDDLWLHAKDVSGSHVIVRQRAGQNIPYPVLEYAAQLAAFYSKRKNDTLVPVTYTPRKYIRKRKGDPAGLVVVSREEVIMVEPVRT